METRVNGILRKLLCYQDGNVMMFVAKGNLSSPFLSTSYLEMMEPIPSSISSFDNDHYFAGLDVIHELTSIHNMVTIKYTSRKENITAIFKDFVVSGPEDQYALEKDLTFSINGTYTTVPGTKGMKFSTFDSDNDGNPDENCAEIYGAWWHTSDCDESFTFEDGFQMVLLPS